MKSAVKDHFNVCGVVIHINPAKINAVRASLAALPAAEIHAVAEDARMVVTVMDTEESLAIDQLAAINRMDGVVSATIAYHEVDRNGETGACNDTSCACGAQNHPDT